MFGKCFNSHLFPSILWCLSGLLSIGFLAFHHGFSSQCFGELLASSRDPPIRLHRPPSLHSALKDTLVVGVAVGGGRYLFSDIDCLGHDGHTSRGEAG